MSFLINNLPPYQARPGVYPRRALSPTIDYNPCKTHKSSTTTVVVISTPHTHFLCPPLLQTGHGTRSTELPHSGEPTTGGWDSRSPTSPRFLKDARRVLRLTLGPRRADDRRLGVKESHSLVFLHDAEAIVLLLDVF